MGGPYAEWGCGVQGRFRSFVSWFTARYSTIELQAPFVGADGVAPPEVSHLLYRQARYYLRNILPFHILRFAYYVKLHYVTYNKLTRQGMILRPSHYECDATNQLSYGSMCYHSTIVRMILARESISPVNAIAFHILLFLISSLFALTSLLHVSVEYSLPLILLLPDYAVSQIVLHSYVFS
jgi:hypothetical protein